MAENQRGYKSYKYESFWECRHHKPAKHEMNAIGGSLTKRGHASISIRNLFVLGGGHSIASQQFLCRFTGEKEKAQWT